MGQKKLLRFRQLSELPNVFEKPEGMAGTWKDVFHNQHPVILELACGRGEYTVGLAAMHAHNNYIGVDIKGNRMYIGAKKANEAPLPNAAFLRTEIEAIHQHFAPGEIDEIWITFPDPQLRHSRLRKRLTHPRFLRLYKQILKEDGIIHLKTDSPDLFAFTKQVAAVYNLKIVEESADVYASDHAPELEIRTHYEGLDIAGSSKIFYLKFSLPQKIEGDDEAFKLLLQQNLKTVAGA